MMVLGLLGIVGFFIDALPTIEFDFAQFADAFSTCFMFVLDGIDLLGTFLGSGAMSILGVYLGIIVLINSFYIAYQLIWWFIKKIPMLDIRQ